GASVVAPSAGWPRVDGSTRGAAPSRSFRRTQVHLDGHPSGLPGIERPFSEHLLHVLVVHLGWSGADELDALDRSFGSDVQDHDNVAAVDAERLCQFRY